MIGKLYLTIAASVTGMSCVGNLANMTLDWVKSDENTLKQKIPLISTFSSFKSSSTNVSNSTNTSANTQTSSSESRSHTSSSSHSKQYNLLSCFVLGTNWLVLPWTIYKDPTTIKRIFNSSLPHPDSTPQSPISEKFYFYGDKYCTIKY